ncbi:RluA family pseudouridine synthase [Saltatorellus ferox]|uniref:RluA family pseudouridine synthase n=1 Tax=Saltatorellus ferox TaxID=2528018 RepID=UPI003AF380AA
MNKPPGLPVVPDSSEDDSLFDLAKAWIKREYQKPGDVFLGVVHRLDRPVSGVVCFARTSKGAARLGASFREKTAQKSYMAITSGPKPSGLADAGVVEHWLLKDPSRNMVKVVPEGTPGAKLARSEYRFTDGRNRVELSPVTGRSHQLRVALASLGTPILGDLKYGADRPLPDKSIALHARRLVVPHPTRDEVVDVTAPLPSNGVW